jgi:MFS family permease
VTDPSDIAPDSERDTRDLDDVADRKELRDRFDMLLQELRVSLPGVQVLTAFLLTAPFSQRFGELDLWGRRAYGVALTSSMLSVVCLIAPTLLHRLGERRARSRRLLWSVRLMIIGLVLLGVALMSAMWGIARFVFGTETAWWLTAPAVVLLVTVWLVLPLTLRRHTATDPSDP